MMELGAKALESVLVRVTQQIISRVNNAVEIFKSIGRTPLFCGYLTIQT